jgi:hypothetical protein
MKQTAFKETVYPGLGLYLALTPLPPAIWLTFLPFDATLGVIMGSGAYAAAVGFFVFKSPKIFLDDEYLRVSNAKIEREFISNVRPIAKSETFRARGAELDSRAFTRFQIGVNTMLRIEISDPRDSTPYWLLSTRKVKKLARALDAN